MEQGGDGTGVMQRLGLIPGQGGRKEPPLLMDSFR